MIRHQIKLILIAIMFYTRIPVAPSIDYKPEYLNQSTRYFPLIGLLVGSFGALVYWCSLQLLNHPIALIFSMAATVLLTGAFHEDGFADMCDAFGGGWTIEKKLSIMKDSRIGTYGSVGLIFILSAKFMLLYEINPVKLPLVLIFGHTVSRIVPVWLIYTLPYVQDIDVSKSKPIGHKNKLYELFLACGIAVLPFLIFKVKFAFIIVFLILFTLYFKYYLKKQIGGYTGDCLGASQQLGEIIIYIAFLVIWKFLP